MEEVCIFPGDNQSIKDEKGVLPDEKVKTPNNNTNEVCIRVLRVRVPMCYVGFQPRKLVLVIYGKEF